MDDQRTENLDQHETLDPHSARRIRIDERRTRRHGGGWAGGAILIGLGILLLLQNFGNYQFDNWWAFFIMIPALGAFSNAWAAYQDA